MTGKESLPPPQTENAHYTSQSSEEGMSFIDFVEVLIRKKGLIFLIAATSTLISIGYALSVTPVYKARIGFLPPQKIIIPELFPLGVMKETSTSLYKKFLARLQLYSHREKVFKSGNFIEKFADNKRASTTPENLFSQLNSSISLTQNLLEKNRSFDKPLYLEMLGSKPEAMVEFLNSLSKVAIKNIQTEVINNLLNSLQEEIQSLKKEIQSLKTELGIARNLKIVENNFLHARSGAIQPKWFLYGHKALKEEINKLQLMINDIQETSVDLKSAIDDNNGSKPAQSEHKKFDTSNFSQIKIEVASISQPSTLPLAPVEPRKPLIISIGVLMGLFLGVILAFISDAIEYLGKKKRITLII
jgi:LPS O-antigen subunit length determinant protein (WzzB/FepE family)